MVETAITTLIFFAYILFAAKRLLTYLHVLQQEEYDNIRLLRWMNQYGVYDKRLSLALFILGGLWFALPDMLLLINFAALLCFAFAIYKEQDPRKRSKKKLVTTSRVKRIFFPAFALLILLAGASFYISAPWFWVLAIQVIPFILFLSNIMMMPIENGIQERFLNEAKLKMQNLHPKIIAITGSYGKTSTKHILGHILKTHAPTLITPGSVNTPMGITRIIREELTDTHKYFIVEMGAYGPGSIERLCALTPPDMGIITAIGHAHYERFKSLDTVAETKYELAQAVINKGNGKIIVHESTLEFPAARAIKSAHAALFIIAGETAPDLKIISAEQHPEGLTVKLSWKDEAFKLSVPLYGIHHAHNAALAFAAAMELGLSADDIQTALRSLPQISHRLELKPQSDGSRLIDDAYNSNPSGFKTALDLLFTITPETGRKILITPGMVELGKAHDEAHKTAGEHAGHVTDITLLVASKRIPSFIEGFKNTGKSKTLIEVNTFAEAAQWLEKNRRPDDVVLLENDLPDIYERVPRL